MVILGTNCDNVWGESEYQENLTANSSITYEA